MELGVKCDHTVAVKQWEWFQRGAGVVNRFGIELSQRPFSSRRGESLSEGERSCY